METANKLYPALTSSNQLQLALVSSNSGHAVPGPAAVLRPGLHPGGHLSPVQNCRTSGG